VLLVFGAPCQLPLLAGPEHGRTTPLAVMGCDARGRICIDNTSLGLGSRRRDVTCEVWLCSHTVEQTVTPHVMMPKSR